MPRNAQPDTESVFYVHPSEGPNSVLVAPPLDESNYLAWSRSMIRAFGAKNKLKFIDGYMVDEDDLNRSAWVLVKGCFFPDTFHSSYLASQMQIGLVVWTLEDQFLANVSFLAAPSSLGEPRHN